MKNFSRLVLLPCFPAIFALAVSAQNPNPQSPAPGASKPTAPAAKGTAPGSAAADASNPDTANAYFHFMMAHEYEEMATTFGRSEYATRAI